MKKTNWQREYFDGGLPETQATLTDEQQALLADIKTLEGEMHERKHGSRYTREQNAAYRDERMVALQLRFYQSNQATRAELDKQVWTHRADYLARAEADAARVLLEAHRWQIRYGAFTPAELDAEVDAYASEQEGYKLMAWTPDRLDALSAASIAAGRRNEAFEEMKADRHYLEPWRNERPAFYKALPLYESEFGVATVVNAFGELEDVDVAGIYMESDEGNRSSDL